MKKITLNGKSLTLKEVVAVACDHVPFSIAPEAIERVERARAYIDEQVLVGDIVYGVTTGFGPNADTPIPTADGIALQRNLLISHCTGMGAPLPHEVVRAMMLIRLNTLLAGHSGIQLATLRLLEAFLALDICPYVPAQGSVGASGDLAPLSHMAVTLIGEGKVHFDGAWHTLPALYAHPAIVAYNAARKPQQAAIQAHTLLQKEALALINGTTLMNALGALGVHRAYRLIDAATRSAAAFAESIGARRQAFDPGVHAVRRHAQQQAINAAMMQYTEGSTLMGIAPETLLAALPATLFEGVPCGEWAHEVTAQLNAIGARGAAAYWQTEIAALQRITPQTPVADLLAGDQLRALVRLMPVQLRALLERSYQATERGWQSWYRVMELAFKKVTPQDSYSVRCTPQVLGASLAAVDHVAALIEHELNAVVDNPILLIEGQTLPDGTIVEESRIVSGGNFHGQPIALSLDYLKLAMAEVGNLLERQICKLTDKAHNDGLPAFLAEQAGLHSGLMIFQYTAASLVSENKVLVHPATADSVPTSANQEDHVSMGPIAGRQALEIIGNVEQILTLHRLVTKQALQMRQKQLGDKIALQLSANALQLIERLEALGISYWSEDRMAQYDIERAHTLWG